MRRRMSEALAKKQEQKSKVTPEMSPSEQAMLLATDPPSALSEEPSEGSSSSAFPSVSATMSSDSARTIRAPFDATPGTVRTPSYPFPRMHMKLQRGLSSRSGPHHRPFTLLSPTSEPPEMQAMVQDDIMSRQTPSDMSTPIGHESRAEAYPEDPNYPTPDLYDMVLMLSTEPGLEAWWANVTEILAEAFGAERASLALPGDITDLENVPWGQKATFNINNSDSGDSTHFGSNVASEVDTYMDRELTSSFASADRSATARRPPLVTRHSIAGVMPERSSNTTRSRPTGPTRAISTISGLQQSQTNSPSMPRLSKQSPTPQEPPPGEQFNMGQSQDVMSLTTGPRCCVYRSLQRLEAESDPLLVRTGVAGLFGKRKPVVLTRAYSEEEEQPSASSSRPTTPLTKPYTRSREGSLVTLRAFEDYEQPEPSPWSQSPSPSPAARPDPQESPFFTQVSTIDEDAFSANPPVYDYGASANQSLSAIGTDSSKTLVHIPLIQPVPSRKVLVSSLRFPVAILSFLTNVTPYPRNLRHSLYTLLPHLASTFSLAHQYSSMQERLRGGTQRQNASFGLGGTFSDEGSELELVNELSTQIQHDATYSKTSSLAGSIYSPSDRASIPKLSPPTSVAGTPFLDQVGMNTDNPSTPSKSGSEMVDSYFSAKRVKQGGLSGSKSGAPSTPGAKRSSEVSPERQRKPDRSLQGSQSSTKKQTMTVDTSKVKSESQNVNPARSASMFSDLSLEQAPGSDASMRRALHRDSLKPEDGERNLPELIAALMLNAVPLQLFLAKPTTGDLVWTNRKFDAFRSQGEGRVRDPWKNVHSADRPDLVTTWKDALKTGSQFTHYIRVRRFNSDSDFRWFVFRASTMLSNSGRLLYWVGSFLDVHEQYMKNLEAQEMQASMARDTKLRALADAIPQVLFEAVEGEGIVAVNQQWHSFSGQTIEEARGLGFARHVHRDDLHKCGMLSPADLSFSRVSSDSSQSTTSSNKTIAPPRTRQKSLFAPDDSSLAAMIRQGSMTAEKDENGRTSYTTEIRLRSKKGEFRWFLVRLVKVHNEIPPARHASWYGTCTDIEIRMKLERDLNEANKKVHSEMESKTKFFANMSHEIRTPLNGILGSMPWLVESQLDPDQRRTLDTIQNSANNLRELVDNILDVTKVEAGKMTLIPKWFNVRSLLEEVVDTCSSRAIERGLELNYTLDAGVPLTVKGDPFRVRQVLLNLMGNSVKFTEVGEVYMRCTMMDTIPESATSEPHARLHFDVVDTGRGFNEIEFTRLFKQFGQIEGASQHDAGSGLGLFLSKQLVEMHGGELSVSSKVGQGSTFSFYVRVEVVPPGQQAASPEHPLRPGHRHSVSFGTSPARSSTMGTPVSSSGKTVVHTPGLSKYTSPQTESPAPMSPAPGSPLGISESSSSAQSFRSNSGNIATISIGSSNLPTPESMITASRDSIASQGSISRNIATELRSGSLPVLHRAQSDNLGYKQVPDVAHPQTYSVMVICPAEHARNAIKQHIEHVVPHSIPLHVTTTASINDFLDLRHGPSPPVFTHIVLNVPATSDIMLFMRQIAQFSASVVPALIIVTDHFQKRDIAEDFMTLTASGKKAFLVHKPVKPSVVAMIFDPAQLRNLSKDVAREAAQTNTENFRQMAASVKDSIGNRHFRLLLVEDSDTNRLVIQRYLKRVGLASDEARDGQECVEKIMGRPHGYYNLVICDIQMPKKNGYQACVEIRDWERQNAYPNLPIMALTANAMPEERAAAGAAGFTDYLTKPVDFNRLGRMMVTLLDPKIPHTFLRDQNIDTGRTT